MKPWLLILLLLGPAPAHAMAGFAETHSDLLYDAHASVHWIHPGDGCDCGSTCFQLQRARPAYGAYRGLERSLRKINAPAEPASQLVFVQACGDAHWIVYDRASETTLVDTPSYEEALATWRAAGLRDPRFADAEHGARGLRETWASTRENVSWIGLMYLPLVATCAFMGSLVAFVVQLVRYLRSRLRKHLVWAVLALLPSVPGWWLLWTVLGYMQQRPGH